MDEEPPENQPKHALRVRRRPLKKSLKHSSDSERDWPKDFPELVEWYAHQVEDVTRAAQLRIKEATEIMAACANREISLDEAGEKSDEHFSRWGNVFPDGIEWVRGMSDEEIVNAMKNANQKRQGGRSS